MLSEAQGVSLRITSDMRRESLGRVGERGFDLARTLPKLCRRPLAKGVGLRVMDSHTGNHPKDDFTPLEIIQRSYSVIRERIPFELEEETFKPERGYVIKPLRLYTHSFSLENLRLPLIEFSCKRVEVTTDSGGRLKLKLFVVHPESITTQIKDRNCKTKGVVKAFCEEEACFWVFHRHATRAKTSSSKDDAPFLTVFDDDEGILLKNHLDNHIDLELLDLHDYCYARQAVVAKAVNMSDDMGSLVGKLVSPAIVYGRCRAFEHVAGIKEPFDLSKVKGYLSSYKKDHTQASNDLATATFPWLDEFVADPSAPLEALLKISYAMLGGRLPWGAYPTTSFQTLNLVNGHPLLAVIALLSATFLIADCSLHFYSLEEPSCTSFMMSSICGKAAQRSHELLSTLKKGSDLSAPFDKKRLSVVIFSLRLCTSLSSFGYSTAVMTFTFKGLARIPCLVMRCPKNGPSSTPKEHFFRLSFMLIYRNFSKVSFISAIIYSSEHYLIQKASFGNKRPLLLRKRPSYLHLLLPFESGDISCRHPKSISVGILRGILPSWILVISAWVHAKTSAFALRRSLQLNTPFSLAEGVSLTFFVPLSDSCVENTVPIPLLVRNLRALLNDHEVKSFLSCERGSPIVISKGIFPIDQDFSPENPIKGNFESTLDALTLAFITTDTEELLPSEGNVISLLSEVRPLNLPYHDVGISLY
nr:hypothetical protein [Tanacetum cinerariifolium]